MLCATPSHALFRSSPRRIVAVLVLTVTLLGLQHALVAHGELEEQIARITAQIVKHPANPDLLVKRSELYRTARQYKQALADLDRAARMRPNLPAADLVRAYVLFDVGHLHGAVDAASRFLTGQPAHADALVLRARARVRLGRAREAAIDFTRAIGTRAVPDWYIERARVTVSSGLSGVDDALRGLDDGIRRLGPLVTLELEAIDLELRLKRYDAALPRLDRIMAQAARKETYLARRGAILESAGRIAAARAAYQAALAAARTLPPWIQRTAASSTLVERLRGDLARLDAGTPASDQKQRKGPL